MIRVEIANEQDVLPVDEALLREAIVRVLTEAQIQDAVISLAIVDDAAIRPLNAQFLGHDYVTDVLSFVLEQSAGRLEGEVIVSAETAQASAARFAWRPHDELLLYVIHGALHLVGQDDLEPDLQAEMRHQERRHLAHFGLSPHYDE
jgi:probable rRNA maturation factor